MSGQNKQLGPHETSALTYIYRCWYSIQLPSPMIGDKDPINSAHDCFSRVVCCQNALEDDRQAGDTPQPADDTPINGRFNHFVRLCERDGPRFVIFVKIEVGELHILGNFRFASHWAEPPPGCYSVHCNHDSFPSASLRFFQQFDICPAIN